MLRTYSSVAWHACQNCIFLFVILIYVLHAKIHELLLVYSNIDERFRKYQLNMPTLLSNAHKKHG
jgi:hypothetical protein